MRRLVTVVVLCVLACSEKDGEQKTSGGGETPATGAAPAAEATERKDCAGPRTCSLFEQADPKNWSKGTSKRLPADFPAPPAGASVCGELAELKTIYFIIPDDSGVLKHYQTALASAGWKADAEPAEVPGPLCDMNQDFSKGKEHVSVYVFGSGAFTLLYHEAP